VTGPSERDRLIVISAMSEDRLIGAGDGMPWKDPAEYAHYLSLVRGCPLLFGRRTFEIFGADVADRPLVVLTRDPGRVPPPSIAVSSFEEGLAALGDRRAFVGGGAGVYQRALDHADALYLSTMKGAFEGDTRFPAFDRAEWPVLHEVEHPTFVFRVHRRA
jgi:dihydrofolate reductase